MNNVSINILNLIMSYIENEDIINFSRVNKLFYYFLNPENNPHINSLYRDISLKKYFNINNKINAEQFFGKNIYDDFKVTKNNWKNILKNLYLNSKIYPNKEISELVYNSFNIHCYLPYQIKQNKILEYENCTLHQMICSDIKKNDYIANNYYDKNFKNSEEIKIEPLKKGLSFEKELVNLKLKLNDYKDTKIVMKLIINYSYEELNNLFISKNNKKNYIKKNKNKFNSVLFFIIWLNHTFILFINLLYNYVYQFRNYSDSKKIIIEYSKIHSDLINFGLSINEQFNNINIILNYLKKENEIDLNNQNEEFKIYDMFLNIMNKNFYQKLKPILNENIEKLLNIFYNENLNKEEINNSSESKNLENIETSNTEALNDENCNDEDNYNFNSFCSDKEDFSWEVEDKPDNGDNLTTQEIIEQYSNLILDFSINSDNAKYINHSKIKLNEFYNEYENIILNKFSECIKNNYKVNDTKDFEKENEIDEEINSLNILFTFLKKIGDNDKEKGEKLKLINRTKLNLLKSSENIVFNYLNNIINKKFSYDLKRIDNKPNEYINIFDNNIILNNLNLNNNKYYNNISYDLYINKLQEIKNNLINNNLNIKKTYKKNIEEMANSYIYSNTNKNENKLITVSKNIILYFYNEYNLFNCQDKQIFDILFKEKKHYC